MVHRQQGYRINFGTNNPPNNIENNTNLGLVTTYVPNPILSPNTTYYWEIIPYNGAGSATGTVVWSFTTGADPTISTLPYTQNFDGVTEPAIPYGWSIENTNGDSYAWTTYTSRNSSFSTKSYECKVQFSRCNE